MALICDLPVHAHKYPLLSLEEELSLVKRITKGDRRAYEKLFQSNLRLVLSIARKYVQPSLPISDLFQEGCVGLNTAIEKFDIRLGHRFSTYATWWIRQSVGR